MLFYWFETIFTVKLTAKYTNQRKNVMNKFVQYLEFYKTIVLKYQVNKKFIVNFSKYLVNNSKFFSF